jgi:hypothetical protein
MKATRNCLCLVVVLAAGALLGCGEAGPKSYRVSGTVKLDGQPIPFGEVIFTPDGKEHNSGPQGIAEIHDGQFDTRLVGGKGMAGGPTIIRVNGMSGPGGKTLCEYEMKLELPRENATHDLDVPKSAAVVGEATPVP